MNPRHPLHRFAFAALATLAALPLAAAEPLWLVTPDEVRADAAWGQSNPASQPYRTRAFAPGLPEIAVVAPTSLAAPLTAPFPIRVVFKAQDGAAIKPDSFRAYYGFLKVDITERLAGRAKVGANGIDIESAAIPAGNHRLFLRVSDDRDRESEKEIRFSVQ